MTLIVCFISLYTFGSYSYVSIPIFSLGVIYSSFDCKKICIKDIFTIILITIAFITSLSGLFTENVILSFHIVINYIILFTFLLFIQKEKTIKIKPNYIRLLNDTSYNIYLVHNKVLYILITINMLNLTVYILAISFVVIVFTSIRKICKI